MHVTFVQVRVKPEHIDAFVAAGFKPGMVPGATALGGVETLGPLLLRTLDSGQSMQTGSTMVTAGEPRIR